MNKLAIIQLRGTIRVSQKIKDSLKHLKLKRVNNCRIIAESPSIKGVLEKIKHLVTWGIIDEETLKLLKETCGKPTNSQKEISPNKTKKEENSKFSKKKEEENVYSLHPARKGYGRKGVKMPFAKGGAYGNRFEKINDLIKRMLK